MTGINKTELIKELRALTQAGMKDCKDSLEEVGWNLQKAVDAVKAKGLSNTTRNATKTAAEGVVQVVPYFKSDSNSITMVEINCQTDFVANSPDFKKFADHVGLMFSAVDLFSFNGNLGQLQYKTDNGTLTDLEMNRKELMATTKENIVVRRWWRVEAAPVTGLVCSYLHSNSKIGVIVSLETSPGLLDSNSAELLEFGEELAMQIAAMSPLAVTREQLPQEEVDRQKGIFETQLTELNKPQAAWPKIMEGKFNKWYTDVCLLDQESVVMPKTSVKDLIAAKGKQLGGEIKVLNFVRAAVGEGIETVKADLAADVASMIGE